MSDGRIRLSTFGGIRALGIVLALGGALAGGAPASAALNDGQLGGPPEPETGSTACPPGRAVTGVTGRVGDVAGHGVVGSATVECQAGAAPVGTMGATGTPTGTTACAAGQVAVGIEGTEGDFIDQLALRCRAGDLTGAITSAASYGGTGGVADGPYECPAGQVLAGLSGSVATGTVRHVVISCAPRVGTADGKLGGAATADAASTVCPTGKGVTSVTGHEGEVSTNPIVASATAQCQDGAVAVGTMGDPTALPGSTACAAGQVAVGIEGREGDFVDQLALRCRAENLTGAVTTAAGFPGTGGTPDGPYDCPAGQQLVGLDGTLAFTATTVRDLVIRCGVPDRDADGVANAIDNCPLVANGTQINTDGAADGGNACDADDDNDGRIDGSDSCPTGNIGWTSNGTTDRDSDGCRDAGEDTDDDNDGKADGSDSCPTGNIGWTSNGTTDADNDGCRDAAEDLDDDNDTVADTGDNCPLAANQTQTNTDGVADGGDACDADDDNDTVVDGGDNCQLVANATQTNTDGAADGGDACDADDDNDTVADGSDNCSLAANASQTNTDGAADGGDDCDADDDNDTVTDGGDNCQLVANAEQADVDADGLGNACDPTDNRPPVITPTPTPAPATTPTPTSIPPVTVERLTSTVSSNWVVTTRHALLRRLIVNDLSLGATVTITCKGKGCPFKSRVFKRGGTGSANATKPFARKKLRLNTVLVVQITKPGAIGRSLTYRLRKRKVPRPLIQCLPVGSTKPAKTC